MKKKRNISHNLKVKLLDYRIKRKMNCRKNEFWTI